MVVNDKVLVREMKEAYKGWGYGVMVTSDDRWMFSSKDNWTVLIDGQNNVPNEVLALIVLHMGELPDSMQSYRVYKGDKGPCIQKEVYKVELENLETLEKSRPMVDVEVRRTQLTYGRRRVWQQIEDKQVLTMDPRYEGLMEIGAESKVCTVGQQIYLEGEISCVYISRARNSASEAMLQHLAQFKWT